MGIMAVTKTDPLLLGESLLILLYGLRSFEPTIAHVLMCVRLTRHGHYASD